MQKSHNSKIRTSKFGFAESILSDINPVGPRWVQVSTEFPIKNHQTRINLYSKKLIIRHIVLCPREQYSINLTREGRFAASLERLTRLAASRPGSNGLLAPSALEPGVPPATRRQIRGQKKNRRQCARAYKFIRV